MTVRPKDQVSLTEQVAVNAAAFASNMNATYEGLPAEVIARAVGAFTDQYAAYWVRQIEAGRVSFMDTDLPDDESSDDDR